MIRTNVIGKISNSNRHIIDMSIPMKWHDAILDYQDVLGEGLGNTISLIIMNFINDRQVELKKKKEEEIEQVKKHEEFAKAALLRKQTYTGLKGDPQ